MYHILFIHSSVDEHLGCFHFWLLWIMQLWTWVYKSHFQFFGVYIPVSGIAQSYGNAKLHFLDELSNTLTWQLHHFTFPPAVHEGSNFSTSSPMLVAYCLLIIVTLIGVRWEVISKTRLFKDCGFGLWCVWFSFCRLPPWITHTGENQLPSCREDMGENQAAGLWVHSGSWSHLPSEEWGLLPTAWGAGGLAGDPPSGLEMAAACGRPQPRSIQPHRSQSPDP